MSFYWGVGSFALGIFISSFFKLGFSFFLFLLILSFSIWLWGRVAKTDRRLSGLVALVILTFALGILRYEIKEIQIGKSLLPTFVGQKVVFSGVVDDEPAYRDQGQTLIVKARELLSSTSNQTLAGEKILVRTGLFPEFRYGDLIRVKGLLARPENFTTDNNRPFDYVSYLAKDEVFYSVDFAEAEIISSGHGSGVKEFLFSIKSAFLARISVLLREPELSLLGGLLLGAKDSLGQSWQEKFQITGVSHIVALSGYNITIVAAGVMTVLSFLPRFWSLSFGALGIVLFALMTGAGATVVRASIMALIVLLAKAVGRKTFLTRALLVAGLLMLIHNPKVLVFDLSFQLSFLATLALLWVAPLIEERLSPWTKPTYWRELLVATLATQIFVLPFALYKFGILSLVALPVNLLILPVIPWIMLFGFLAGLSAFVIFPLGWLLAVPASWLLSYVLYLIDWFSLRSWASLKIVAFPLVLVVILYLVYGVVIFLLWRRKQKAINLAKL